MKLSQATVSTAYNGNKNKTAREKNFFYSVWYTVLITVIAYLVWLFDMGIYGIMFMGALLGVVFATSKDLTPITIIIFEIVQVVSDVNAVVFDAVFIVAVCIVVVVLVGGMIIHIVRFKPINKNMRLKGFSVALIACGISIIIGGIDVLPERQILPALVIMFYGMVVIFCALVFNDGLGKNNSERLVRSIIYALIASALLAAVQMFTVLIELGDVFEAIASKYEISTGYGYPNYLAYLYTRAIPICVYFASKNKKGSCLWLLGAYFFALCIVITSCRAALLMGAIVGVASIVYFGIKTERKKDFFITIGVLVLITAIGLIIIRDEIKSLFATLFRMGLDSNGRFDLWKTGLERFIKHPIFGVGIDYDIGGRLDKHPTNTPYTPYWYHNTIVQIMCSLGIIGCIVFVFYFYRQYRAFALVKKTSVKALMFALIAIQLISLLDIEFLTPQDFFQMAVITYGAVQSLPNSQEETFFYKFKKTKKNENQ